MSDMDALTAADIEAEAARLRAQIESTLAQIEIERARQRELHATLQFNIDSANRLADATRSLSADVSRDMKRTGGHIDQRATDSRDLLMALRNVSENYFRYKNLAEATRDLTRDTTKYNEQFRTYNQLRRISLGSVMAVDTNLIGKNETRTFVEKEYLKNTDYWLSYATMAIMLWWNDEKAPALRARDKALTMSQRRAALYFMFCNMKFGRAQAASEWYNCYLQSISAADTGPEFQYLLEAYLSGALRGDEAMSAKVSHQIDDLCLSVRDVEPQFDDRVASETVEYMKAKAHTTAFDFFYLPQYCDAAGQLRSVLSDAEKNALCTDDFRSLALQKAGRTNLSGKIEDSIYQVIESMDDQELAIYRRMQLNELIVASKGDVAQANKAFEERYPANQRNAFSDLMIRWAFADNDITVLPQIRRWAVARLAPAMRNGMLSFVEGYRREVHDRYTIHVDQWSGEYGEGEIDQAVDSYNRYYAKNRWKMLAMDKFVLIFASIVLVGLVVLVCSVFHPIAALIVAGALCVVAGVFCIWRRIDMLSAQTESWRLKSIEIITKTLEELGSWRQAYKQADAGFEELDDALRQAAQGQ